MFSKHIQQAKKAATSTSSKPISARPSPNPSSTDDIRATTTKETHMSHTPTPAHKLKTVSTATLATALFKRGLRNQ